MFKNKAPSDFSVHETISEMFKAGHKADGKHEHMWGSFDVTDGIVFADRAC